MQLTLFGVDRAQVDLIKAAAPHYPPLWRSVMVPWNGWIDRRRDDPMFRSFQAVDLAWFMSRQIREQAIVEFAGTSARPLIQGQNFALVLDEMIVVTFKKLKRVNGAILKANHFQKENDAYYRQRSRDGFPDFPRLVVGYMPLKELSEVKLYLGLPRGNRFEWLQEIPDQSASMIRVADATVDAAQPERKGFRVKARKDSEKQG